MSREATVARSTRHGEARRAQRTAEYVCWRAIKARCGNPKSEDYELYGARGIRICDEWRNDFGAFLAHVGRRPSSKHSIDRIDNNGNYEPGNVRWATPKEQRDNQRPRSDFTVGRSASS